MSPGSSGSSLLFWGSVLTITSVLTIVGGFVVWSNNDDTREVAGIAGDEVRPMIRAMPLPPPDQDVKSPALHGLKYDVEKGLMVVKIQVVPDGDELIIDANTGRLLEARPGRAVTPGPMGKFAAPFVPMM